MEPIRVLLVDQDPGWRETWRTMLRPEPDIVVVGEAEDDERAEAATVRWQAKVVLIGTPPARGGIERIGRLQDRYRVGVILLTGPGSESHPIEAWELGVRGCLRRDASPMLLASAVRAVYEGAVVFGPSPSGDRVEETLPPARAAAQIARPGARPGRPLTAREVEILELVAQGRTNRDIAEVLSVTPDAVKKHVQSIIAKLGAADRTDAAVRAVRAGLIP